MNGFPDYFKIEIGKYIDIFVKWLTRNFEVVFDTLKDGIMWFLLQAQTVLLWIPWYIAIMLVIIIGCRIKNWKSGISYGLMIFLIGTFGLWDEMMITIAIMLTSVIISIIIGIPTGIIMSYKSKLEGVLVPILDAMQTMPSFVYLIPAVYFFGLGTVPAVFATIIYATPPVIRLTNLAIRNVSNEMREAAYSFGSSNWQVLFKIELPQAFPTIMTGINQTTMMAMSMVVISSMIGAKGLGMNVVTAMNRIDIAMGFEAGISIVFLAIIIDRLTQGIAGKYKYVK